MVIPWNTKRPRVLLLTSLKPGLLTMDLILSIFASIKLLGRKRRERRRKERERERPEGGGGDMATSNN